MCIYIYYMYRILHVRLHYDPAILNLLFSTRGSGENPAYVILHNFPLAQFGSSMSFHANHEIQEADRNRRLMGRCKGGKSPKAPGKLREGTEISPLYSLRPPVKYTPIYRRQTEPHVVLRIYLSLVGQFLAKLNTALVKKKTSPLARASCICRSRVSTSCQSAACFAAKTASL